MAENDTPGVSGETAAGEAEIAELLEALTEATDTDEERELIKETVETDLGIDVGLFGQVVVGFDRGDVAETLLGSVLFGIPMFVEGGTTEVGAHLATSPLATAATLAFAVVAVYGIVYVSDIQDVRVTRRLFGLIPRRLAGVLLVPLVAAVVGLTVWGRVDWAVPAVATGSVVAAYLPMAIGAALGDILPGT
ncbi:MAG: DUF2391 domain-containing protein [Haloferacaceae archaeon]